MDVQLVSNKKNTRSGNKSKADSPLPENLEDKAWLLGQPPLGDYIEFVEEAVAGGADIPQKILVDEWRAANDHYGELEESEAGFAEGGKMVDLDPALQPLVDEVMADSRYRHSFDKLPTRFAMVELDRMLVGHPYVTHTHTERLKEQIDTSATPEELFRFCLPLARDEARVQARKTGSDSYTFWSSSSDFRYQETVLLGPEQIDGFEAFGPVSNVIGAMVGYGSNFLNVIESENRFLIHNGHHRACALRAQGFTHAPCIVQSVTRLDELKLAAARAVREDPAFYFRAPRPPVIKDFFDSKICKILRVQKEVRVVEVKIEVNEYHTKDFAAVG